MKNKPNINASELKQWDFCPKQWYLLRTGGRRRIQQQLCSNQASRRGQEFHQKKSGPVKQAQKTQSVISNFLTIGGLACLFWLLSHLQ